MSERFYVTTPLYYVNDKPHIGHSYTTVAADVIARYRRAQGADVHFLTGTDEHGQKVLQKATERGLSPQAHADELHQRFKDLWVRLDITYDDFIRTTEPRHTRVVQQVLQDLYDRGEIYEDSYAGWYSTAAERFWTEKDLVDGKCPESGQPVEWLEESNLFFRMSKYADQLREWADARPEWVTPESRYNELQGALRKDIGDLCITRPVERMPWGIPIPWDDRFVTYVWFDALLNYITAVGYKADDDAFSKWWPADVQLLGKDILTTHTVYWGTMLFALGLEPARHLLAHGWWTVEGQKMSKSLGNVVDPHLLVDAYGADSVRYVLMAEKALGPDGDFSHKGFQLRYNAELANDIGNLAHRALSMTEKWLGGVVPALGDATEADGALARELAARVQSCCGCMDRLAYQEATREIVGIAQAGNNYIQTQQPWALNKAGDTARLAGVMRRTLEVCRVVAVLLQPFCPNKAGELLGRLGLSDARLDADLARLSGLTEGATLTLGDPLFPRLLELPDAITAALEAARGAAPLKSLDAEAGPTPPKKSKKKAPKARKPEPPPPPGAISKDQFEQVQLRAGRVLAAEAHPNADRLLVLTVDLGEDRPRTICAGVAGRYQPDELVGLTVVVVANLKPAKLRGVPSEGMILAAGDGDGLAMVTTLAEVEPGAIVR
ncbi:MAG: methionine--tRNA ligase [Alphaproteobacteria bacterium]|nr:methionine--tRNA ligase [Alphaproteobacteria bacterium]